jgi:hypothetical protein
MELLFLLQSLRICVFGGLGDPEQEERKSMIKSKCWVSLGKNFEGSLARRKKIVDLCIR